MEKTNWGLAALEAVLCQMPQYVELKADKSGREFYSAKYRQVYAEGGVTLKSVVTYSRPETRLMLINADLNYARSESWHKFIVLLLKKQKDHWVLIYNKKAIAWFEEDPFKDHPPLGKTQDIPIGFLTAAWSAQQQ
jgi:hypothetical protein